MNSLTKRIRAFIVDDEGATATEYAVLLALIIVVCIAAVAALGDKVSDLFVDVESALP